MADPLELKAKLRKAADNRATADWHKRKATEEAAELMDQISDTPGVSMTDAAEILGVSRQMAYRILKGDY